MAYGVIEVPAGQTHLRKNTIRALVGSSGTPSDTNVFVTSSDPRLSNFIFGDRFNHVVSTLTTTSTVPQLYAAWVTPTLEAGNYLLKWSWTMATQSNLTPGNYTVNFNSTTPTVNRIMNYIMASVNAETELIGATGVALVTLPAGSATFRIFLNRVGATPRRVSLHRSFLELVTVV